MFEFLKFLLPSNTKGAEPINSDELWGVGSYNSVFAYSPRQYINSFQIIEYIALALRIITDDISRSKWVLENELGEYVEDENINALFKRPSRDLTWEQFLKAIMLHLLLDGNFFLVPDFLNMFNMMNGLPTELIILNPAEVHVYSVSKQIIRDTTIINTKTGYYQFQYDGATVYKNWDEIYHGKRIGPNNTVRGMGKIAENNKILNHPRLQSILTETFIKNGAKIDYLAVPEEKLGTVEYERWKKQVNQQTRGFTNFFKMFLAPFKMTLQKMNVSHDDIQASEQRILNRDDIVNYMFQIPAARVGASEKSKQNTTGDEMRNYHENVLPSYWTPVESVLNQIIWKYRSDIRFKFLQHKWVNIEQQATVGKMLSERGSINGNEYRELVGITRDDSNEHLNTYYMPVNLLPAGDDSIPNPDRGNPKKKELALDQKAKKAPKRMLIFHKSTQRLRNRLEKKFSKDLNKMYKEMERRVLAGLDKDMISETKAAEIDDVFDLVIEEGIGLKMAKNNFTSFMVQAITQYDEFFGSSIDTSTRNPNFTLVVEKLAKKYVNVTLNTNREDLKKLLSQALEEGVALYEIKERIKEYFNVYTNPEEDWKAIRIARTEISHIYDQAAKFSFQDLGVKRFQVVGCTEIEPNTNCDSDGSRATYPLSQIDALKFHPNHLGTVVPVLEEE